MIQSRNRFFLSCVANRAGIGLFTNLGTSSSFRHPTGVPLMTQGRNFTGNFHSTIRAGCFLSAFRCTPRLCHNTPAIFGNITVVALLILNSYRSNAKIIGSIVTIVRKVILIDCHFNRDRIAKLLVALKRSNFFQIVVTRFSDREGFSLVVTVPVVVTPFCLVQA